MAQSQADEDCGRKAQGGRMSESDADMLARAIVFDAGPMPTIGNWIMPEDADADGHPMQVVRHCGGWCVTGEAMMHLNPKDGGTWEFKTLAHHFASPSEAFAFLRGWKERQRMKAGSQPWMKPWRDPRERDA
jgi:uncharacterized Fe-S cluster protein YjdI